MIEIKLVINPIKEQINNQKRQVDRSRRVIKREQRKLEHEKRLKLLNIKNMVTEGQIENAKLTAKDIKACTCKYKILDNFARYLLDISLKIPYCSTLKEINDLFFNKKILPIINNPSDPNFIQKIYDFGQEKNDNISNIDKYPNFEFVNEEIGEEEFFNQILKEAGVKLDQENARVCNEKIEVIFNNTMKRKVNSKCFNNNS